MPLSENDISLLLKALHFASDKHRNQRRKDENATPYINHPIEVAELLWNRGCVRTAETLIAALLHDTIEDTQTSPEELKMHFGEKICHIVEEVTDNKQLPKSERKRLQIEHAPHLSPEAQQVKLADKISNVQDLSKSIPRGWTLERCKTYVDWSENVVSGLRGVNPALEALFDEVSQKTRQKLQELDA